MNLKKLKAIWYQKLKESGFEDIEDAKGMLKQYSAARTAKSGRNNDRTERERLRQVQNTLYYARCTALQHTPSFKALIARFPHYEGIWALYCDGVEYQHIAPKYSLSVRGIRWIIYRIKPLLKDLPTDDESD